MTETEQLREVSRQKQVLIENLEFRLRWARFINECFKCQHDLERFINGDFKSEVSLKLDTIQTVLNAEG